MDTQIRLLEQSHQHLHFLLTVWIILFQIPCGQVVRGTWWWCSWSSWVWIPNSPVSDWKLPQLAQQVNWYLFRTQENMKDRERRERAGLHQLYAVLKIERVSNTGNWSHFNAAQALLERAWAALKCDQLPVVSNTTPPTRLNFSQLQELIIQFVDFRWLNDYTKNQYDVLNCMKYSPHVQSSVPKCHPDQINASNINAESIYGSILSIFWIILDGNGLLNLTDIKQPQIIYFSCKTYSLKHWKFGKK